VPDRSDDPRCSGSGGEETSRQHKWAAAQAVAGLPSRFRAAAAGDLSRSSLSRVAGRGNRRLTDRRSVRRPRPAEAAGIQAGEGVGRSV